MKNRKRTTEILRMAEPRWTFHFEGGRAAVRGLYPLADALDDEAERIDEDKEGLRTAKKKALDHKVNVTTFEKKVRAWIAEHPASYQRRLDIERANIEKAHKRADTRDPVTRALDELKSGIGLLPLLRSMQGLDALERELAYRSLPDNVRELLEPLPPIVTKTKDGIGVEPLINPKAVREAQATRLEAQIPEETRRLLAELEEEKATLEMAANLLLSAAKEIAPDDPMEAEIRVA